MNKKQELLVDYLGPNYLWNVRQDNAIEVTIEKELAKNKKLVLEHCIVINTKGIVYYSTYDQWLRAENRYEIDVDEARKLIKLKLKFSCLE